MCDPYDLRLPLPVAALVQLLFPLLYLLCGLGLCFGCSVRLCTDGKDDVNNTKKGVIMAYTPLYISHIKHFITAKDKTRSLISCPANIKQYLIFVAR